MIVGHLSSPTASTAGKIFAAMNALSAIVSSFDNDDPH